MLKYLSLIAAALALSKVDASSEKMCSVTGVANSDGKTVKYGDSIECATGFVITGIVICDGKPYNAEATRCAKRNQTCTFHGQKWIKDNQQYMRTGDMVTDAHCSTGYVTTGNVSCHAKDEFRNDGRVVKQVCEGSISKLPL